MAVPRRALAVASALSVAVVACGGTAPRVSSSLAPTAAIAPSAAPSPSLAPESVRPGPSRIETGTFPSAALQRVMPYATYLPAGYDADAQTRYPVLYLLHGLSGSNEEWQQYAVPQAADQLIESGEIPPLLIVFPQGDQAYWVDHANGGPRWGLYSARDVVREIDARYRTLANRRYRAVGGLSMGADGALQLSLNYPDAFGVAGAHSPVLRRFGDAPSYFGDQAQFAARDPYTLALARPQVARTITLWIDIGEGDPWRPRILAFHDALTAAGIPHTLREYPGSHSAEYWSSHAPDYLRFYGAALCGARDVARPDRPAASCPAPRHASASPAP